MLKQLECKQKTCSTESHTIDVLNFFSGEEVTYSVVVIEGTVKADKIDCQSEKNVIVKRINGPWGIPDTTCHHIAANLNFKCILRLEHGINTFIMQFCSVQREFILSFRPRNTPFRVLPVYILCKGHDGQFQAPPNEDNSIDSACERIDLGLRLAQSVFAERLKKGGYGRNTFQLQSDLDPMVPEVHVFYSIITVKEAHSLETEELWALLGRELMLSHLGKDNHKFVGFLSSTRYNGKLFEKGSSSRADVSKCTEGYAAIAGGGFALLGTACLHTWATSVEEVVPRLTNLTEVDTSLFLDDSPNHLLKKPLSAKDFLKNVFEAYDFISDSFGTGTYGGCYATTLGTTCHELSHIFDVGHTTYGIMGAHYRSIQEMFLPEDVEFINMSALPTSCPKEEKLSLLRSADGVHDLRTSKEVDGNEPAVKQNSKVSEGKDEPKTSGTLASLVQELKVAWTVSQEQPRPRLRAPTLRTNTDPRSGLPHHSTTDSDSATNPEPLNLTSTESGQQDKACSKSQNSGAGKQDGDCTLLGPVTPDYFGPTFGSHEVSSYWPPGALALLAYNKWINPAVTEEHGTITYHRFRKAITSTHGLRVVELRDKDAKSILYWKFDKSTELTKFTIPEYYFFPNIHSLCIIDSIGSVLKVDPLP